MLLACLSYHGHVCIQHLAHMQLCTQIISNKCTPQQSPGLIFCMVLLLFSMQFLSWHHNEFVFTFACMKTYHKIFTLTRKKPRTIDPKLYYSIGILTQSFQTHLQSFPTLLLLNLLSTLYITSKFLRPTFIKLLLTSTHPRLLVLTVLAPTFLSIVLMLYAFLCITCSACASINVTSL